MASDADDSAHRSDAAARLRRLGGDRLLARLIDLFLVETPARLRAAREAEAAGDLDGTARPAHALRTSAGMLGAREVQRLAERLEAAAAAGDRAAASEILEELERAAAAECARLRERREALEG